MDIDYKALTFGLQLFNSAGVVVVGIYSWFSNRQKANATAIEAVKDSIVDDRTAIETRFARLESEIKHLPTHKDIGQVYDRVNEMAETLSALSGQLGQINSSTQMIHEFLLNQGARK